MTDNKKISLTVQYNYVDGYGYAFFSSDDRGKLGISAGDYVKISGGKTALARAHFHPDVHPGKIVLTKDVRLKAVANFDSPVEIEKITPLYADKITIQPRDEVVKVKDIEIFRDTLQGELVYKGYEIPSYYYTFVVTDVSPSEYAIVTSATQFIYKDRVHKEDEESDRPEVHYEDIGGLGRELSQVREMIEYPLRHPEVFEKLGIEPPKGVLLYGPPGTGKTLIAKAVATESQAKFYEISGPEIVSKYYGDSEEK
ncbi:MAG: AAA family ATPase, partial [Methanocorpusculum sp.]|nr:AAA family ATPase [Methanocorpusculum sp.]